MLLPVSIFILSAIAFGAFVLIFFFLAISFRTVVPTNSVHIVQSGKQTKSFGKDMGSNTYYKWPSWIPSIGVKVTMLPLSVFRVELQNYSAYDKGRLPFILDVLAFFRISDPNKAAERISTIEELDDQLQGIMQGVVRTILAQSDIESILGERAKFSDLFTAEVKDQLPQWGIETVKNIELMDVRDEKDGRVIANIMAKKKSEIEKESRVAVATNMQAASIAEVEAKQAVDVRTQQAEETVGIRTAGKTQAIGIADQKATQAVKVEEAETAKREVDVRTAESVGNANIMKSVKIVQAEQDKQVAITNAEGEKQKVTIEAEGALAAAKLTAQGVQAQGEAKGAADTAVLMAPIKTQIELAQKIGENGAYQEYLIHVKQIEAARDVGMEQARNLSQAEIKIFANTGGNINSGVSSVFDFFGSKGGMALGAMLEAFKSTPAGEEAVDGKTSPATKPNGASLPR